MYYILVLQLSAYYLIMCPVNLSRQCVGQQSGNIESIYLNYVIGTVFMAVDHLNYNWVLPSNFLPDHESLRSHGKMSAYVIQTLTIGPVMDIEIEACLYSS